MNKTLMTLAAFAALAIAPASQAQTTLRASSADLEQTGKFMSVYFSKRTGDWGFVSNRSQKQIADDGAARACRNQKHHPRDCEPLDYAQGGYVLIYACEGRTLTPLKLVILLYKDPDYQRVKAAAESGRIPEGGLMCERGTYMPQAIVDTSVRGCKDDYNDICVE